MSANEQTAMTAQAEEADAATATVHEMRITQQGKMHSWVDFALDFFQKNPEGALTLHTLPAKKNPSPDGALNNQAAVPPESEQSGSSVVVATKPPRMHTSTSTIPRLISVVEIIKREYLKTLDPELSDAGKLSGLHQYNELGELEENSNNAPETAEEERQQALITALQGKRHLRQHKVPFMKVTLCLKELPDLVSNGATYQKPQVRILSRSAKARLKRRTKKSEMAE